MKVDLTQVPKVFKNDKKFIAMWAIRQFRLGIVSIKQIDKLEQVLIDNQMTTLDIDQVKEIIGYRERGGRHDS